MRSTALFAVLALLALALLTAGRAHAFVNVGGVRFRTLSDVDPTTSAFGCEDTAAALPDGWKVAEPSAAATLAAMSYQWGTICVVLSDGSSIGTRTGSGCGTGMLLTETDGSVHVAGCSRRVLLEQAGQPDDTDVTVASISNTVVFNGNVYAVLSNNAPSEWGYTCQSELKQLPVGWSVASDSADVRGLLMGNQYTFGTVCVVLADGSSLYTTNSQDCGSGLLMSYNNHFGVQWCYRQVLITRPAVSGESDSWTVAPFIDNYISYNGYAYAAMDNTEATQSAVGCQSKVYKLASGWSIANNDADAQAVVTAALFGTNCLVLADGKSYNHAGQLCSGGVNQLLSDPTSTYYTVNWCDQRVLIRHALPAPQAPVAAHELPMRVLLMSVTGDEVNEPRVASARQALLSHGIPFDEYLSKPGATFETRSVRASARDAHPAAVASNPAFELLSQIAGRISTSAAAGADAAARAAVSPAAPSTAAAVREAARALLEAHDSSLPLNVREPLADVAHARSAPTSYKTGAVADVLYTNGAPNYYAIVSTTPELPFQDPADGLWKSSLTEADTQALEDYARTYHVRVVQLFSFPQSQTGTTPVDFNNPGTGADRTIVFDANLAAYMGGVRADSQIAMTGVWNYPTTISDPSIAKPAMTFVNAAGASLGVAAVTVTFGDTREELHMFFDHATWSLHSSLLAPVWINWATRGMFVGLRRVLLSAQIDDIFLESAYWNPVTNVREEEGANLFRMSAADLHTHIDIQNRLNAYLPAGSNFVVEPAFNGNGVELAGGKDVDALYQQAKTDRDAFFWESHTYTHLNLNAVTFIETNNELQNNIDLAKDWFGASLDYPTYSKDAMVTPQISGLFNGEAIRSMVGKGIIYAVGDNSRPELVPANKYHGIHTTVATNGYEGLYIVPRSATEIYYDCSLPASAVAEYNYRYTAYWGRELTMDEIAEVEGQRVAKLLFAFRYDPYMFHQANMRVFDWINPVTGKVEDMSLVALWTWFVARDLQRFMTYPVLTYKHHDIAQQWLQREARDACGIDARLVVNSAGMATGVRLLTSSACSVAVTGASFASGQTGVTSEAYGPDTTAWVDASASTDRVIPFASPVAL